MSAHRAAQVISSAANTAARAAAARGALPEEAFAAAAAAQTRTLVVDTPPGLEPVLERELQDLGIPGEIERRPGGVSLHGPEEALWRIALESRVAETVWVRAGKAFHAPYKSTLGNHASGVQWRDFVWFGSQAVAPSIRTIVTKSRLYHSKLIEQVVVDAIEEQRSSFLGERLQNIEDESFYGESAERAQSPCPLLRVQITNDECEISVLATDSPRRRAYESVVDETQDAGGDTAHTAPDTPLSGAHAASCVLTSSLLRQLELVAETDEELVVWDPFCGGGTLLLEALGVGLGVPPSSPAMHFPFAEFPNFSGERFGGVVQSLRAQPCLGIEQLTLLGTDRRVGLPEAAKNNLASFLHTMPRPRAGPATVEGLPCRVHFQACSIAEAAAELAGKQVLVLTNVPYGQKKSNRYAELDYEALGDALQQIAHSGNLRGAFCLSARDSFARRTGLEWRTELRFSNVGIRVDFLRWTGRVLPPAERKKQKKPNPRKDKGKHKGANVADQAESQ